MSDRLSLEEVMNLDRFVELEPSLMPINAVVIYECADRESGEDTIIAYNTSFSARWKAMGICMTAADYMRRDMLADEGFDEDD